MKLSDALAEFADDLEDGPKRVLAELEATGHRGANNMVRFARKRVQGLDHAPAYPYAIGYDFEVTTRVMRWEVGPDKNRRQGALGNLIEYGSVNNPPNPHVQPALNAEEEAFLKYGAAAFDKMWG